MADAPEQGGLTPRDRRRAGSIRPAAVAVLVLGIVAGGVVAQRTVGARAAPVATAEPSLSGAWFCPHGGSEGWKGWVWLTNPGAAAVRVRLTTFGANGVLARSSFAVPPGELTQRPLRVDQAGAATEVEYFGGWVGAATVVQTAAQPPSTAASRCEASSSSRWFMTDANTARGDTATVVVMNPFAQPAVFDVIIRTDKRPPVRPGSLTPLVLPARTSTAIRLGDFVLQAPAERLVTADLAVQSGRIIAGGLVDSDSGLRAETAARTVSTEWVLPAARYTIPSTLTLMNPGSRRADLTILAQSGTSQRVLSGVGGVSLPGQSIRALALDAGSAGLVVRSTNGVPVVAARRVLGERGDVATLDGAAQVHRTWMVLPAAPPAGGHSYLILENPGTTGASVIIRLLSRDGEVSASSLSPLVVPAARTIVVDLFGQVRSKPITVVVSASNGTVVAAGASYARGGGYASTLGVPIPAG